MMLLGFEPYPRVAVIPMFLNELRLKIVFL